MRRGVAPLALIAAAGAIAGFLAYRWVTPGAAPIVQPVPLADAPTAAADGDTATGTGEAARPRVPDAVPDVVLHDLAGKPRQLREFSGQPTIINFWATWCVPCRREIPLLNALRKDYASKERMKSLEIVGIAVDFKESVVEFAQKTRLDYPVLIGEQDGIDAANKFGMELVLPFSVFVDRRERIIAVKVGELHREEAVAILAAMQRLEANELDLPAARQGIAQRLKELAAERARKSPQSSS